jgi:hypothetical protein
VVVCQGRAASKSKKKSTGDADALADIFEQPDVEEPSSEPLGSAKTSIDGASWKRVDFLLEDEDDQSSFDESMTDLRPFYDRARFLLKSAADAQAYNQPVACTPLGNAAAHLQSALAQGDQAKKFSKEASDISSSRIPKSQRPVFAPMDNMKESALKALLDDHPTASAGSSRQTIEIYDPNGSIDNFHKMRDTVAMLYLQQPYGPSSQIVCMIPQAEQAAAAEKLSRSRHNGPIMQYEPQYEWAKPQASNADGEHKSAPSANSNCSKPNKKA